MISKVRSWHSGLSKGTKAVLWVLGAITIFSVAGASRPAPVQSRVAPITDSGKVEGESTAKPVIIFREESTTEPIPFSKITKDDATLLKGRTQISQPGANGIKTIMFTVTVTDGKETKRELSKEEVTLAPVDEVTLVGTKIPAPVPLAQPVPAASTSCHPSYGGCVPMASDVDCAGGSGNGPAYVQGPVSVIGPDVYDLDRDGNGIGCE